MGRLKGNPDFRRWKGSWELKEWRSRGEALVMPGHWAMNGRRQKEKDVEGRPSGELLFVMLVLLL